MKVTVTDMAEMVMRTAREETRLNMQWWIDYLKKWDTSPIAKEYSRKLDMKNGEDTYVLLASQGLRIFYTVNGDEITVLDMGKQSVIDGFREAAGDRST